METAIKNKFQGLITKKNNNIIIVSNTYII